MKRVDFTLNYTSASGADVDLRITKNILEDMFNEDGNEKNDTQVLLKEIAQALGLCPHDGDVIIVTPQESF